MARKSYKTKKRIENIQHDLKSHHNNIHLLRSAYKAHQSFNKNIFSPRVIKYTSIPKSENLYQFTLTNISSQIVLLEKELATLIEYGH